MLVVIVVMSTLCLLTELLVGRQLRRDWFAVDLAALVWRAPLWCAAMDPITRDQNARRDTVAAERDETTATLVKENAELRRRLLGQSDETSAGSHTALFVYAVVGIAILAIVSIVVIFIVRPDKDNTGLIAIILGFLVPPSTALLAAAVQQVHLAVNSRLSQLVLLTRSSSFAEGAAAAGGSPVPPSPLPPGSVL
jgi:hypothetical protein